MSFMEEGSCSAVWSRWNDNLEFAFMAVICTERPPLRGDVCTILWSYFSASRKAIRVESLNCVLVGVVFKIKDVKWLEYRDEGFQGAKGNEKYVEKYRSVCSIKFEAFKRKLNANLVRRSALQCRFVPLLVCTNIFRRRAAWPPPESIPRLFEPRLFQSPRLFPLAQPANTGNATWNSVHDALGKSLATYLSFLSFSLFLFYRGIWWNNGYLITPMNLRITTYIFTINSDLSRKHTLSHERCSPVVDRANITIEIYRECGKLNKSPVSSSFSRPLAPLAKRSQFVIS